MEYDYKDLTRRYVDLWNAGNLEGLAEFWAPNVVHHARYQDHDAAGIRSINETFMKAFPDLRFQIDDLLAEGDKVVARLTAKATHRGEFLGLPATGESITCTLIEIMRFAEGKIVEHWGLTDELHMMAQVGLVPREHLAAMS